MRNLNVDLNSLDCFERPVKPSSRNAEVSFVRRHVMNSVMFTRQNDVVILQNLNPDGQAKVCMRPLVNLNVTMRIIKLEDEFEQLA